MLYIYRFLTILFLNLAAVICYSITFAFYRCFPSLAKDNENFIEAMRVGIVEVVQKALLEDFDAMIDEDITKSLENFSTVVKNSSGSKGVIAWRPTGDPELHMMAHDAKVCEHLCFSLVHCTLY